MPQSLCVVPTCQVRAFRLVVMAIGLWTVALCSRTAVADVFYWNDPSGGSFDHATRWTPNGIPDGDDTVVFDLGVSPVDRYTVYSVDDENMGLIVGNDSVAFDLSLSDYTLNDPGFEPPSVTIGLDAGDHGDAWFDGFASSTIATVVTSIGHGAGSVGVVRVNEVDWSSVFFIVGHSGMGSATLEQGMVTTSQLTEIGQMSGATGTVVVTGPESLWTSEEGTYVARGGSGYLTIENRGDHVANDTSFVGIDPGSYGMVTVTGFGSTSTINGQLILGSEGEAHLLISNEGRMNISEQCSIASKPGSVGEAVVTGIGSDWFIEGGLIVGSEGEGALRIEQGGRVASLHGSIGSKVGGVGYVEVTGAWSRWYAEHNLSVGYVGLGTLLVSEGGLVSSGSSSVGGAAGAIGEVTITGAGSTWNIEEEISVGSGGQGTLMVEAGGSVFSADGRIAVGAASSGTATVTGAGSVWINSSTLSLGGYSSGAGGTGTLNILDQGAVEAADTLFVWGGGTLNLVGGSLSAGTIQHTSSGTFNFLAGTLQVDTFNGNLLNQGGILSPGQSPGTTTVNGDYEQAAGTLLIELDTGGAHDQLIVTEDASLAGTLAIDMLNEYTPDAGDMFTIVTANSIGGAFNTVTGLPTDGDVMLGLEYSSTSLVLRAVLTGDYNADGFVGQDDLSIILSFWGQNVAAGTLLYGDASGDGFVGQDDLNLVLAYWGEGAPPSPLIPEPTTLALVLLGSLVTTRRRGA